MKRLALSLAFVGVVGCGGPEQDVATQEDELGGPSYRIISSSVDNSVQAPLRKIDTVVQAGNDSRNRFVWHKVYRMGSGPRGAIILLPTAYANFDQQMLGAPGQSLAEQLANARYEVHGYSPRTSRIPTGACSSGEVDCSIMASWGYETYLEDIDWIRRQLSSLPFSLRKPVIGGLSTGAGLAMAAVNERPTSYAGLLFMDMLVTSDDPFVVNQAADNCALYTDYINFGFTFDDQFPAFVKAVAQNEADFTMAFGVPTPELGGTPDFQFFASNAAHTMLTISSFARAQENGLKFNDVESLALLRDEQCMWAGDETFTYDLDDFRKPILAIKQGLGFGDYMQPSLDLTGTRSSDVDVINNPGFGHLDTLCHPNQTQQIVDPLLDWLDDEVF